MRRRILLALAGLTTAILMGAVIPLGLIATAHDHSSYIEDARSRARAAAASAEESLADGLAGPGLRRVLASARGQGDSLAIMKPGGGLVAATRPGPVIPRWLIGKAASASSPLTQVAGDRVLVVTSVRSAGHVVGLVALTRSTGRLENVIHTFWLTLAIIGAGSLAAAILIGLALARWVASPLAALDTAARKLGDGDLRERAPVGKGPAEIRRLAGTFNTMAGRLEALLRGHRAVVEDVSHQLRTPLAALRLRLDLLRPDPETDPEAGAELTGALDEVARLSRLVDGMLAVARAENATPRLLAVPVAQVIADRSAAWAPVAAERGIRVAAAPAPLHALIGDGYLEQILDNLIANAIDAGADGNHVTISAHPTPRGVRIVVADDGPGMTPAQMQEAFRRFSSASTGGAGLGLAIVDRLVTASGGTAALARTGGSGLTVTIDLPSAAAPGGASSPAISAGGR